MAFKKMETQGQLPGPRAIVLSGYNQEVQKPLVSFLDDLELKEVEIIFTRMEHLNLPVSDILKDENTSEIVPADKLPPVMLISGLEHEEFDVFIRRFKENGISRPIFATTTVHNLNFDFKTLLQHLLADQKKVREAHAKAREAQN